MATYVTGRVKRMEVIAGLTDKTMYRAVLTVDGPTDRSDVLVATFELRVQSLLEAAWLKNAVVRVALVPVGSEQIVTHVEVDEPA